MRSPSEETDLESPRFHSSDISGLHFNHCNYDEFLALFDIPIGEAAREGAELQLPHTHLLDSKESGGKTIIAPTELRANVQLEKTNLVARMFSDWEEIPIRLLEQVDLRHSLYGYIGKDDYTMFPIIRPASLFKPTADRQRS